MGELTAVAMSGGLDSSVVAWILAQEEPPVVGLSMLLWEHSADQAHGRCCGSLDLGDAKRVAQQVGIPHYTLRLVEDFRRHVVDPFVGDYLNGRTPSPCIRCNSWIKFDRFVEKARSLGARKMATGHYARIRPGKQGLELHTALDSRKDQSYYLFEITQEQLAMVVFPLGEMTKSQVRSKARQAGLVVAEKGESMEVCFVSRGIRDFVEDQVTAHPERFPVVPPATPSQVVDSRGQVLGEGEPYYRYTVGQRRGLKVATGERLYVLEVQPQANRVIVGRDEETLAPGLSGERLHWIGVPPSGEIEATVKIRSRHAGVAARISPLAGTTGEVEVEFEVPQAGVAPGQAAVFYQGTQLLGGCWIGEKLN